MPETIADPFIHYFRMLEQTTFKGKHHHKPIAKHSTDFFQDPSNKPSKFSSLGAMRRTRRPVPTLSIPAATLHNSLRSSSATSHPPSAVSAASLKQIQRLLINTPVSFPAEADLKPGQRAKLFNVSPKVWDVYNHGNNNCTSILGGTSFLNPVEIQNVSFPGEWLLGQPFFSGHYGSCSPFAHLGVANR